MSAHRGQLSDRTAVVLIGCFLMLQPLSTDFYLASLPGLTQVFATSITTVQLTLSVFILTFGVMQLVVGPLSDRYGRMPIILGGLVLYIAATIGCALAPTIDHLIAARFFQGVGCCAAVVVARAIISDVFDPLAGAKVMAQASTLLAIGPLFGPVLGSWLEVRYGFRAIFAVVAVFAALLLFATARRLVETNARPDPAATRPRTLVANYARILRSPHFLAYALVGATSYGGLFAFISGSSFVLIRVLGVPTENYGYCFSVSVLGYLVGTIACRRLLARIGMVPALRLSSAITVASGLTMAGLAAAGVNHWAAIVLPQIVYMFAHGINFPCAQAGAVTAFPRQAGAAAGVLGFLTMAVAATVGWWIGISNDGTVIPLTYTIGVAALAVGAVAWGWVGRLPPARVTG